MVNLESYRGRCNKKYRGMVWVGEVAWVSNGDRGFADVGVRGLWSLLGRVGGYGG